VWSTREVIDGLKKFFFNNHIWPDFTRITDANQRVAVLKLCRLAKRRASLVGAYSVTAIPVNHVVPSVAFLIGNKKTLLLHVGDTGPTDEVWSISRKHKKVDRKSTRLNSSHVSISYAVFCLKKKKQ